MQRLFSGDRQEVIWQKSLLAIHQMKRFHITDYLAYHYPSAGLPRRIRHFYAHAAMVAGNGKLLNILTQYDYGTETPISVCHVR